MQGMPGSIHTAQTDGFIDNRPGLCRFDWFQLTTILYQASTALALPQIDITVHFQLFETDLLAGDLSGFERSNLLPQDCILIIQGLPLCILPLKVLLEPLEQCC